MTTRRSFAITTAVIATTALLAWTVERVRARHAATTPDDRWTIEEMRALLLREGADPDLAAQLAPVAHSITGGDPRYLGMDVNGTLRAGLFAVPLDMEVQN